MDVVCVLAAAGMIPGFILGFTLGLVHEFDTNKKPSRFACGPYKYLHFVGLTCRYVTIFDLMTKISALNSVITQNESNLQSLRIKEANAQKTVGELKALLQVRQNQNRVQGKEMKAQNEALNAKVKKLKLDSHNTSKQAQIQKPAIHTSYTIKRIIDREDIIPAPRGDIKNEIDFASYKQIFNKHEKILKEWNVHSNKLQNMQQRIKMKADDDQKYDVNTNEIGNTLYTKYISTSMVINEQTKRLHKIGTNDNILQLLKTQNKLAVK